MASPDHLTPPQSQQAEHDEEQRKRKASTAFDDSPTAPDSQVGAHDTPEDEAPARHSAIWTNAQNEQFFDSLREFGRDFDKVERRVPSKSREQIRNYYYRTLKKVKGMLSPAGIMFDSNNHEQERQALLCYWELRKKLEKYDKATQADGCIRPDEKLHSKFPKLLVQLVRDGQVDLQKGKRKIRVKLPSIPQMASEKRSIFSGQEQQSHHKWAALLEDSDFATFAAQNEAFVCRILDLVKFDKASNGVKRKLDSVLRVYAKPSASDSESSPSKRARYDVIPTTSLSQGNPLEVQPSSQAPAILPVAPVAVESTAVMAPVPAMHSPSRPTSNSPEHTISLLMFPRTEAVRSALEANGCRSQLKLTVPLQKPLPGLLLFLKKKWAQRGNFSGLEHIRLFPTQTDAQLFGDIARVGWGWDSHHITVQTLANLRQGAQLELEYCWPIAPPARQPPALLVTEDICQSAVPAPLPSLPNLFEPQDTRPSLPSLASDWQRRASLMPPQSKMALSPDKYVRNQEHTSVTISASSSLLAPHRPGRKFEVPAAPFEHADHFSPFGGLEAASLHMHDDAVEVFPNGLDIGEDTSFMLQKLAGTPPLADL
eukprot:m.24063 g.24063  ORF g.24063 m.24063 type:complete len:598 (-) comp4216_c0_seq1:20-1813(-)